VRAADAAVAADRPGAPAAQRAAHVRPARDAGDLRAAAARGPARAPLAAAGGALRQGGADGASPDAAAHASPPRPAGGGGAAVDLERAREARASGACNGTPGDWHL